MVKITEAEDELPFEWNIIHTRMEKEFRAWADEQSYTDKDLHVPPIIFTIKVNNWLVQVFSVFSLLQLRFRAKIDPVNTLKVSIFVTKKEMEDPANQFAKTLEKNIPGWLPKGVGLDEVIEVVLQRR